MSEENPAPKSSRLGLIIKGCLALLVSIAAFWWAFKDADMGEITHVLKSSSPPIVLLYLVGQLAIHVLKIFRWGLFIKPLGPVSNRAIFSAANLGIAGTFFIPLRLGEFVRPTMIARAGIPLGGAVASVVVERVADGLCSVGMFFIFFQFLPESAPVPEELRSLSTVALVGFGGGLIVLAAAAVARKPVLGLMRKLLGFISENLAEKIVGLISTFLDGLVALGSFSRAVTFIVMTIGYWISNGLLTYALAASYESSLPVVSGLFTISVLVFTVMIPAGPGFAGVFEAGFKFGFTPFGLGESVIAATALVAHAIQMGLMAVFVGLGFIFADPSQRKKPHLEPAQQKDIDPEISSSSPGAP